MNRPVFDLHYTKIKAPSKFIQNNTNLQTGKNMLYFAEGNEEIKIGFSTDVTDRLKSHEAYGLRCICAMPGDEDDEDRLLLDFAKYLKRPKEWFYRSDEILEYCILLMERGFALPDPVKAKELPHLPYSVWGPRGLAKFSIDQTGQSSIFSILPVADRLAMAAAACENHSLSDEWYTPENIIEMARKSMGSIDTDPATSPAVNSLYINAKIFYTKHTNGLDSTRPWIGNLWLNPPYGRGDSSAGKFIERMCYEIRNGHVSQAITCLNLASMSSRWFYSCIPDLFKVHCIINGRTNFIPPTDKIATSPNKGTVLTYFGNTEDKFCDAFSSYGQLLVSNNMKLYGVNQQ